MKKIYIIFLFTGFLFFNNSRAQTTYNDVANIFYNRCTNCHHSGGIAPLSLMNYGQTSSNSSSIEEDLNEGHMPPWPPDTTYTRFLHERIITASEKNAILQWISDGSLEGDPTLAPPAPTYGVTQYELCGTSSLDIQIPTFASNSNSNNSNPYNCFAIPTGLTQDRWIRAFEIVPGNKSIVHHVVVTVDTAGTASSDTSGNCTTQPGDFSIGGWSAGAAATVFPGEAPFKAGMRIKAGSQIIFQIHYAPGSGGELDSTKIRLYFYPVGETGIRPVYSDVWLQNWTMNIAANTSATYSATHAVGNKSISVFSTDPHSHFICTKIENYATKNGSPRIPIINIPDWHYHWQGNYYFPKLLKLPNGYTIHSEHFFDNTTNNPDAPVPLQTVRAGTKTSDEMLFDAFQWLDYQTGDENIDIAALLKCDTLLVCKPSAAGIITGPATVCSGQTSVSYSVPFIDNAETYIWSYSGTGAIINGTGNQVSIDFSASATSGNLTVKGSNTCSISGAVSADFSIIIGSTGAVVAAGAISGSSSVCGGQTGITYSVSPVSNAASYIWSYSGTGATINGTGNQITIDFSSTATSGNLIVRGTNSCGDGALSTAYAILINSYPIVSVQPNNSTICEGNSATISLTATGSNLTYQWQADAGSGFSTINESVPYIGVTTSSITISNPSLSLSTNQYRVIVTSGNCSINSDTATLIIDTIPAVPIAASNSPVCEGGTINLTSTSVTNASYNWVGPNLYSSLLQNPPSITNATAANTGTYSVTATVNNCTSAVATTSVVVTSTLTPVVSIHVTGGSNTVCNGTLVTFTATPTNAGISPDYQWKIDGSPTGNNTSTYQIFALTDGQVVTCELTSTVACLSSSTVTSNSITMMVTSSLTPSVFIVQSGSTTICAGGTITFTATPTNGGSSPSYQWKVNGLAVGTNNSIYQTTSLTNGQVVSCEMTSNLSCVNVTTVTSNSITISVIATVTPATAIAITSGSNPTLSGQSVTFTASPSNGGVSPVYQWLVNNNNVGNNSDTYSTSVLTDGDIITCKLTSNAICATSLTVTSALITMTVTMPAPTTVTVTKTSPNTVDTILTSSIATGNQWYKNGVLIATAIGQIYTPTQSGIYYVVVTTGSATITSASVSVAIKPTITRNENVLISSSSVGNKWYFNGVEMIDTTQNLTITQNGVYKLVVTVNGISSDTTITINDIVNGIDQQPEENKISISPNPNDGTFTISFNVVVSTSLKLEVYNMLGQQVYEETLNNFTGSYKKQISILSSKGVYMVCLTSNSNKVINKVIIY